MHLERRRLLDQWLEHILATVVARYDPDKVILFGSRAEAETTEWSDLDLVIVTQTEQPFLQRLKEVALLCQSAVGVDFLVYTPTEFAQMVAERNPIILDEVLAKDKVLYERQPATAMA